jgi:LPS-assembly lipoprotein
MTRHLAKFMLAASLTFGLAGCLRPLYGSAEYGGLAAQNGLSGLRIDIQGDRLAHYIRNELEFGLRGGNAQPIIDPKAPRLAIRATQTSNSPVIDRITGIAENVTITFKANYQLFGPASATKPETEGEAVVLVTYDRSQNAFASQRAARDAEIQAGRQMAEQIKIRIASYLASKSR